MSIAPSWTFEELTDYTWALTRLLKRSQPDHLSASAQASWRQVDDWLQRAEPLLRVEHHPHVRLAIPPFPLTARQLGALQTEVSRATRGKPRSPRAQAAGRASLHEISTVSASAVRRLPYWRSVSRRRSSWAVIAAAAVLAAAWSWRARKR